MTAADVLDAGAACCACQLGWSLIKALVSSMKRVCKLALATPAQIKGRQQDSRVSGCVFACTRKRA